MVSIFHLGSDVSGLGQPPPEVGSSCQRPWEPGKVDFDNHTGSTPARATKPARAGRHSLQTRPGPCTLVPTPPCMTSPSYFGAKPVSMCPRPSAHVSISIDPFVQGGANPNREGGAVQAGGRAGRALGHFHLDFQSPTECKSKPEAI